MDPARPSSTGPAPARRPALRALLGWILDSWRRPAGRAATWEQAAGHERASTHPVAPSDPTSNPSRDSRNAASGSNSSQSR